MILKALYDYYQRKKNDLSPQGYEPKEITFAIVIGRDGRFRRFESKKDDKKKSTTFVVPLGKSRTVGILPNWLWDNGGYVLGLPHDGKNIEAKYKAFKAETAKLVKLNPSNKSIEAVVKFYATPQKELEALYKQDPLYNEVMTDIAKNFSFLVEGDNMLIAEDRDVRLPDEVSGDDPVGTCLITGRKEVLARLTAATPLAGNSPGASIVSMQTNSGYDSYGKKQVYNSPISQSAEFAYSSALKKLLGKDSHNKYRVGDRVFLFWGSNENDATNETEENLFNFVGFEFNKEVDPNEAVAKVGKFFKSLWSGTITTDFDDKFYILGLAPNVGRIAVVSWAEIPLKEFAGRFLTHFDDMDIASWHKPSEQKQTYKGIFAMLAATTISGKASDALPKLPEALVEAILNGKNYPTVMYSQVLERIRADHSKNTVSQGRAAILKAYLNRTNRNKQNIKQLTPMLDTTYDNPGYLCGRLAAVLEKIQDDAKSGDSIRTRYLAAASATPSLVFPAMLNLSIYHTEKLSTPSQVFYNRLKQEILDKFAANGFPAHLDLNDQGRFFVGYYQQRSDLFRPHNAE